MNMNLVLIVTAGFVISCSTIVKTQEPAKASATIKSLDGLGLKGEVHFLPSGPSSVKVQVQVEGLKAGSHGFHLHEKGDCSAPDFSSAGGHFNPNKSTHGSVIQEPRHAGDLGNLIANEKMVATAEFEVAGLSLSEGANGILGKAVIIHENADDLKSQPAGNSGKRIACGIIQ